MKSIKTVKCKSVPEKIKRVKKLILSAENTIGAVSFIKRSNRQLRNMSFRLHVKNPSYAPKPVMGKSKWKKDLENLQMTVLDVNKVIRDSAGKIIGRGAYRTVPLENVVGVVVKGRSYIIHDKWRDV